MDYRASIPDDENQPGASPWGSPPVTPQRNVSSYNPISSSQSPTPYLYGSQDSGNGFAQDDPNIDPFRRPATASSTASTTEYNPSEQSEASQGTGLAAAAEPQPQPQSNAPRGESSTSESGAPGVQPSQQEQKPRRPPAPQYKLQAKITALERTGKKDPIIRFDVHVRFIRTAVICRDTPAMKANFKSSRRQIYPSFEPLNFAMSVVYIPSSSSLLST
jgi:hypothetical protein